MDKLVSTNPANGEIVGQVGLSTASDIAQVVQKSHAAQRQWAATDLEQRAEALNQAGQKLLQQSEQLAQLLSSEMGKSISDAQSEVLSCAKDMSRQTAEIGNALQSVVKSNHNTEATIYYDPFGVCACITPWNFPIAMPHWLALPALMAGNAVVLKPSEETPLIAQAYVDTLNEFLPANVLQIVHGRGDTGAALVDADVQLIAFTGSRDTGAHIMAAASKQLKRVLLELGGKDPMLVLEGADLQQTAKIAVNGSFGNCGQVCVSVERIFADRSLYAQFSENLVAETEAFATDSEIPRLGPMINQNQKRKVLAQVNEAIAQGARLLYGTLEAEGNFLGPIVLADVSHDMRISKEETFGPVACISPVDGPDEALALANDHIYGLGASIYAEPQLAERIGRQLNSGMVGINRGIGGVAGLPWVGARQSGYGYHHSDDGHRQFAQVRVISRAKSV